MLNVQKPHGARKISWLNVFSRVQARKVITKFRRALDPSASFEFNAPRMHITDEDREKETERRKKPKKWKNMNKTERRAVNRYRATSVLRYKAHNMIGATGSRHMSQRRRASLATPAASPSMFSHLEQLAEEDESPRLPAVRRRAVDTSDYRTCAILQTRLKNVKHYPE
ncbi:hypothetical protein FSP39_015039 [Pinctada imbricata]|uniref:Uncharacterized protein n=1 Tax=Pinctada imbricata TaxID=66713 RepID=A0AA89BUS7_PINIB|nr:hypothetical protein FSP39_015039 [Pinctada imbricata]